MKKYCKALVNIAVALLACILVLWAVPKLIVFFWPFVIAWIISLFASPVVRFLEQKLKLKRKAGSVCVAVMVIALVILVLYFVGTKLVTEASGLVDAMPGMWDSAKHEIAQIGDKFDVLYGRLPLNLQTGITQLGEKIGSFEGDFFGKFGAPTWEAISNFAKSLPSAFVSIIMMLLASYLFVAERNDINAWLEKHAPKVLQERFLMIRNSMVKAVGGYLKAQLKIEIWVYLLLVVGLWILQVDYAVLIALGIAFLDFLPFFGSGTIMVPWAVIKMLNGHYRMAIGLLIIWGVGQLVRQIIQPKIMGDSMGVPPIPTLILLYAGFKLGGVIGMLVAVPLGLILITMYEEGVFDTTKNSIALLITGINRFRTFSEEDLKALDTEEEHEKH